MVSHLVDYDNYCWNVDLLKRIFLPFEAENICGLPLSNRFPDDKLICAETSNGVFSVRSAYKIAMELDKDANNASVSDGASMRMFWRKLWKMQVPQKIRHFAREGCTFRYGSFTGLDSMDNRNEVRHGGMRKNRRELFLRCQHYMEEYWAAFILPLKHPQSLDSKWSPPQLPFYKVNVNGAVFGKQKEAGVGVVIRDHEGNFIAGLSKKFKAPSGATEVEAKAFETGITFAKEVGIQDFVLEGDSLTIVNALCEKTSAPSSVASLIYGIKAGSNELRNVYFFHVCRSENLLAHLLAKFVVGISDYFAWIEECPCFLEQAIIQDVFSALIK
ncbi:hypothetical protein SO802_004638 [Lithocarpus litseifolius]|uniref:RNase H type-1 domain-containing protein n=1 Tax=Lithocarpus litseifolius TaxID=425828 RepID=A0AAW2E5D6_9ROSI